MITKSWKNNEKVQIHKRPVLSSFPEQYVTLQENKVLHHVFAMFVKRCYEDILLWGFFVTLLLFT